ncbi:Condensin complex subunit 2 [Spathaspora sp. JA1]|nr:Condensin complex subunit 2 [Spathaspora sp. JA1]
MSTTLPKRRGPSGARRPSSSTPQPQQRTVSTSNRILSTRILSEAGGLIEDPIHFHQNKHTILSNFEEWIKMATDNKITVKNSWNFGLIDYFADLNVIKDGENINFQRASATLDGCVKIYSSRVESAASETGKLLSGLAKKKEDVDEQSDGEEQEEGEGEEAGEGGENDDEPKKKRKMNRIVESTLVDFETIKIKKLEKELAIDPLFKKALAEFDEGGAKSLLLNTLSIDNNGRVVFDATTNPDSETTEQLDAIVNDDIDIGSLSKIVYRDSGLDELALIPSLAEFQSALEDVQSAKNILTDLNNKRDEPMQYNTPADFNEYDFLNDDVDYNQDDLQDEHEPHIEDEPVAAQAHNTTTDPYNLTQSLLPRLFEEENPQLEKSSQDVLDRDLMAYFDNRMRHNWRGPEHWKVTAFKRANNIDQESKTDQQPGQQQQTTTSGEKRRHEAVIIDFFGDDVDEDTLFEPPRNASAIVKKDNSGLNKLPDDIQYTSARLITLFTKQFPISTYKAKPQATLTDAQFFGDAYKDQEERERLEKSFREAELADDDGYIENDFGGIDFNDALESTKLEEEEKTTDVGIMGKRSGEYVSFSRVAKRVNVRLLKDNMWGAIKQETEEESTEVKPVKFGQIVNKISAMYKPEQAKDISTSFCFICLLHLANEHGLAITTMEDGNDLEIKGSQVDQGEIEAF